MTSIDAPPGCAYELDDQLRIVGVDAGWAEFAAANQAPELVPPPGPLGQSALSCIADPTSAHLYERLFQRVLQTGRPIVFPIRCDAPALRRFLELRIQPRSPSGLRVESTVVRTEARAPVALLEAGPRRGGDLLRLCSWCKKMDVEGSWYEIDDALAATRLFERELLPDVTHVICPPCSERMHRLLDAR